MKTKKIALIGSAPSSVRLAPYSSRDWEIWGCSPGVYGVAPRVDAWFELPPQELLGAEADNYDKASDTLDVWFDSGVTHSCVLQRRPELPFPADIYLEGSDQHRGWFQSSLAR